MTVITHPVTQNPYTQTFGSGGSSGMQECSLVSATFTGGTLTSATIGFDELGTPLVYSAGFPTQPITSGAIVVQCGGYKIKIDIEPFSGQVKATNIP